MVFIKTFNKKIIILFIVVVSFVLGFLSFKQYLLSNNSEITLGEPFSVQWYQRTVLGLNERSRSAQVDGVTLQCSNNSAPNNSTSGDKYCQFLKVSNSRDTCSRIGIMADTCNMVQIWEKKKGCPKGYQMWSVSSGDSCVKCSPGTYNPSSFNPYNCTTCPVGSIQPESGKAECIKCGQNMTSNENHTKCVSIEINTGNADGGRCFVKKEDGMENSYCYGKDEECVGFSSVLTGRDKDSCREDSLCYQKSDGTYVMGKYASQDGYTYVGTSCDACYKDSSNQYRWTNEPKEDETMEAMYQSENECLNANASLTSPNNFNWKNIIIVVAIIITIILLVWVIFFK